MSGIHNTFALCREVRQSLLLTGMWALVMLPGCGGEPPLPAAQIEAAVEAYLSENTDLRVGQMRVRADRIRYEADRALASVSIMASDDPEASMQMMYELALGPDGWVVVPPETAESDTMQDSPGAGVVPDLPPGHPPTNPEGGIALPPGHPPTTPQGDLPPGHPPITGEQL